MKYFGREDFHEGGMYPTGFHWGYIHNWSASKKRVERYIVLRIPTPLHMVKFALDENLYRIQEWTLLVFVAWPYEDFESIFRYRLTHFWSPIHGR